MPAKAGSQNTNLDFCFHGNDAHASQCPNDRFPHPRLPSVARQFGNQHTAAISLSSLRNFSHEAPPSSLR